ncbi:Vegetative incompatibility protein HET-E-1 [Ceratocystis fimbriata CBS 114723]|uniref:Vegetative incompatibility protein HET-E-1 n=1 Tax=Ceratocystis fimbriata CBS 114723 TaxID=1035309 RepID=A0A2C5X055_9PEZI|nr:Vegetative incompatibility protein HET-E-1 [Ceratocystis fimbriata CBS 114723]
MLQQISQSADAQLCKEVIAKVLVVYRPSTLSELHVLVEGLTGAGVEEVEEIINPCGFFLTLSDNTISFVHQSAKDYFLGHELDQVLPSGIAYQHQTVFMRLMDPLCETLERDIYREEPDWIKVKPRVEANWDACLQALETHGHPVTSVMFSNDGQRLASGSRDTTVKIWDATSGAYLQTLEGHDQHVTSVAFSNDEQRLVSGSSDNTVKIWDATSGACLRNLKGHFEQIISAVFSNCGQRTASGPSTRQNSLPHSKSDMYSLSEDKSWIMENGQGVLWLPPSCRPQTFAASHARFGIGTYSGCIILMEFRSSD